MRALNTTNDDRRTLALLLVLGAVIVPLAVPAAEEIRSSAADRASLSLTIYNDDLALVREVRRLRLPAGEVRVALADVAAKLHPETAQLNGVGAGSTLRVIEQSFDADLLTPQALLEKYIGRRVRVIKTHPTTGAESEVPAEVLSTRDGVVLRMGERIETGVPGRLVFEQIPEGLRARPALSVLLFNRSAEAQELQMSYLTAGLSWRAAYVGLLGANDEKLALHAWVTLVNQSGAAYPDARLRLMAGEVQRVRERQPAAPAMSRSAVPSAEYSFRREALFEYYLYELERPTALAESQTKQVALFAAADVPVKKELMLEGDEYYYSDAVGEIGDGMKAKVYIEFANRRADGLGAPLPAGTLRLYQADRSGVPVLLGEHTLGHTPTNETVRMHIGNAFDVTGRKIQTDFRKLPAAKKRQSRYESAYRIELNNAKPEPVTVTVREPLPGSWRMLAESQPHRKLAANVVAWDVTVPAAGVARLTYRALVEY